MNFIPTTVSTFSDELDVSFNNHFETIHLESNLSGKGIPPAVLSITSPGTHDFGLKANTSTRTKLYTVSYASGAVSATSVSLIATPSSPYSMSPVTCNGGTLNTGQTCNFTITFAPTVTEIHNSAFGLRYFDGAGPINGILSAVNGGFPNL